MPRINAFYGKDELINFTRCIFKYCNERNCHLKDVADKLMVSKSQLSKVMSGNTQLNTDMILNLCLITETQPGFIAERLSAFNLIEKHR